MANRNTRTSNPVATAPKLVLGSSLQAALQQAASTPAMPAQVPGSMAAHNAALAVGWAAVAAATPAPAATQHVSQQVVGLGKPYNVRAGTQFNNVRSWQAVVAFLQANGGQCTVAQLAAHLAQLHNHANFAGYCVRRGYLAPVQATAPVQASA